MADTHSAILSGTLSNEESLAQLHERKDRFIADPDLASDVQSRGIATFNVAINTDAPNAIAGGKPVVFVLQKVLKSIGLLYAENAQIKADVAAPKSESASGSTQSSKGSEARDTLKAQGNSAMPMYEESLEDGRDDTKGSRATRLEAAVAARRKRKLLTHGEGTKAAKAPRTAVSSPTNMLLHTNTETSLPPRRSRLSSTPLHPVPLTSQQPSLASPMARAAPSRQLSARASTNHPQTTATNNKQAKHTKRTKHTHASQKNTLPSLLVKLKVRKLPQVAPQPDSEVRKRRRRKPTAYTSLPFVTSDMDDSDAEMHEPSTFVDADMSAMHLKGRTPQPPTNRPRRNAVVDLTPPSQSLSHIQASPPRSDPWETTTTTTSSPTSSSERSHLSSISNFNNNVTHRSPPLSLPSKFSFPPLPTMPSRDLAPFYKGAQLALENVLEDYEVALEMEAQERDMSDDDDSGKGVQQTTTITMLLDVITELEDNRPTVCDWERRTVLKGGSWVLMVLRGVGEGVGSKKGKGKGKAKSVDVDVDVEEVVSALMEWVDGEFERLSV